MDQIDVVMTATIRPEVLELTLFSFFRHFLAQFPRTRLIINIDPIGEPGKNAGDVLQVCSRFTNQIVCRCPTTPCFADAVRWGWSQVNSDFFLHLEDDWLLKRSVPWDKVDSIMQADGDIASLRFNLSRNPGRTPLASPGMSLNPSVVRREFVRDALPHFDVGLDPEKQLRGMSGPEGPVLERWKYLYHGSPGESSYVIDIGKKWRRNFRLKKEGGHARPTIWKSDADGAAVHQAFLHLKYRFFLHFWRMIAACHRAAIQQPSHAISIPQ